METWLVEAQEALLRRRSRMYAREAQDSQQVQQLPVMLSEGDRQELCDIEDALERIQNGIFGWCSRCGGAIGRHRLRAIPETRYCLACSALVRADIESVGPSLMRARRAGEPVSTGLPHHQEPCAGVRLQVIDRSDEHPTCPSGSRGPSRA
jgi:DnaK suppressor protein